VATAPVKPILSSSAKQQVRIVEFGAEIHPRHPHQDKTKSVSFDFDDSSDSFHPDPSLQNPFKAGLLASPEHKNVRDIWRRRVIEENLLVGSNRFGDFF
jgi:hypothetical protein